MPPGADCGDFLAAPARIALVRIADRGQITPSTVRHTRRQLPAAPLRQFVPKDRDGMLRPEASRGLLATLPGCHYSKEGIMSLATLAALVALASTNDAVLVQFASESCQPCRAMQPAVSRLVSDGYPVQRIDIDRHPEAARQFGVRALPTFVLLVGNREVGRIEGATSYDRLAGMFAAAQSRVDATERSAANLQATQYRAGALDQAALAASVRLKVEDASGFGYGTGTIIDTHGEEALIVTCGHIFRESRGQGAITVDLFAPGASGPVEGHLLGYDLDRDIALVSIKPGIRIPPVVVAPPGHNVRPHDRVFTVGCDQGADATIRQSEITGVNRYRGRPNFTASGAPIDGRSGGGLFTADGLLIGVCNAADPAGDEGVYAGLASIHWQLDQIGQSEIYQRQAVATSAGTEAVGDFATAPPASQPPLDRPAFDVAQPAAQLPEASVAPAHFASQLAAQMPATQSPASLAAAELPLAGLGSDAELVVIIRSKRNPQVRSEIYVVDQATPELLTGIVQAARQGAEQRTAAIAAQRAATLQPQRFARGPGFAPQPVVRGQSAE
jgi:S1-C subfamily serine protease